MAGRFAGFTKDWQPVELVWSQEFATRDEAKAAEKRIKGWSRAKKFALIRGDWDEISRLAQKKSSPSTGSGRTEISVAGGVIQEILQHTRKSHLREACGILFGSAAHIATTIPARNVHPTPQSHFEIDPQALIDAHRAARQGGPQIAGYFHSHPTGDPVPSATDRAMAAHDGLIWAIATLEDIGFWRDAEDGFQPLSYEIAGG